MLSSDLAPGPVPGRVVLDDSYYYGTVHMWVERGPFMRSVCGGIETMSEFVDRQVAAVHVTCRVCVGDVTPLLVKMSEPFPYAFDVVQRPKKGKKQKAVADVMKQLGLFDEEET